MIHVNRGTTTLGVFSDQEVREGLSAGRFAPTDIGWREGMATWQPLSQFPACPARNSSDVNSCRGAHWSAVGAPARARVFQRVHRDALNGAYSSS